MNKIAIIAGVCGLVAGGTGGYLLCHFVEKKKIDKEISDGVQQALDEINKHKKQKAMENETLKSNMFKTTGKNINAIPHFNAIDVAKDIAKENGYITEEVQEPEGAPDGEDEEDSHAKSQDDSRLPFDMSEEDEERAEKDSKLLNYSAWDSNDPNKLTQEEYDARQEPDMEYISKNLDPKKAPYQISEDEYNNGLEKEVENGFWDKVTIIFYTDNVFAERVRINELQQMSSAEIDGAIGNNNVRDFVSSLDVKRAFYRNNKLHIDYEVVRSTRSYSSVLGEDDEEE